MDFQDCLRQHKPPLWGHEHPRARKVREFCYKKEFLKESGFKERLYCTPSQIRNRDKVT